MGTGPEAERRGARAPTLVPTAQIRTLRQAAEMRYKAWSIGLGGNGCPHALRTSDLAGPGQPVGSRSAAEPEAGLKGQGQNRTCGLP